MAGHQNSACVLLFTVCVLNILPMYAKVFSKSMSDFRIFQEPNVNKKNDGFVNRVKRENSNNSDFTTNSENHAAVIHSQNLTLSSTTFALHGVNDNEAFVHWTGAENKTVFVLTRGHKAGGIQTSTLWRSTNFGESYVKIALPNQFKVNHMISSTVDKARTILSDLLKGELFVTKDNGQTWKTIKLPNFLPYRILIHPTIQEMVLAYDLRHLKLYVSEDFCQTWTVLKEKVTERFFFGVDDVDNDTRTVHMELQDPMGPVTYFACTAPNCDVVPVDNSIGTIDFYSLVVEREYIFVQKSVDDITALYVSYKRGPFKKAFFPTKLHPLDFNIVDTTDHQVFIVVDHEEDIANLYLSDVTGQFYVESMENVVGLRYPGKYDVDIVKVQGLKGVYLLNKFEMDRADMGFMTQRSYVTFNKGGNWRLLNAPQGSQCPDPASCNLHFHLGYTNTFLAIPLVVTVAAAPGLILAHGNVGTFLDPMAPTDVYISRDAGLTWTAAPFQGNHFLNILDQGSAISAIPSDGYPTNQVHFSSSEGKTWTSHNFSTTAMTVEGVVNEPGIRTLISSVFGHKNTSEGWVMVKLDYSSVLTRKCVYTDFERWSPSSALVENEVKCIMGENLVYERRKRLADCYVGEDYDRPKSVQICTCSKDDFECDFGYKIGGDSGECVKTDWFNADLLPAPLCHSGKYNKSVGYRRVASSSCEGGQVGKYLPTEDDCPLLAPKGLHIVSAKTCIQRGVNVTFTLTQESGSEDETTYTWSFGNASSLITIKGLQNAASMTQSFNTVGHYNITVVAVNSKGKTQAILPVHVEDEIQSILVEIPWGARTGMPSYFNVTVLGSYNSSRFSGEHSLHFAWQFENKLTGSIRQLTWQNVIQQQFDEPGEYTLTLNVFNSVSSVYYKQTVEVYEDVTTVRLHFSDDINDYNSQSLNIRQALAEILCHNLAQILMIRRSRIIMSVPPMSPTVGDVTILPPKPDERETHKVVQSLIDEAKQQYLSFPLFTRDDIVIITDAGILDLSTGLEKAVTVAPTTSEPLTVTMPVHVNVTMVQEKHSLLAVYISVPVVIAVVITAIAVIIYYKKKLRSHKKYYPIVKHRSRTHHDSTCSCGEEDILGLEEPEDIIIPDNEYPDNEPTLMILNMPTSSRNQRSSNAGFEFPTC